MINIVKVQQKYPRLYCEPNRRSQELLRKAEQCIRKALGREAQTKQFTKGIHRLCGTVYYEVYDLCSYLDPRNEPFLCIAPEDLKIDIEPDNPLQEPFSFKCHPFNNRELKIMNEALPIMEPWFSDPFISVREGEDELLTDDFWNFGMSKETKFYYERLIYPLFLNELSNLPIEEGALVCDPACGTGESIANIKNSFPNFSYIAADRNAKVTRLAQIWQRDLDIYVGDAQDMSYLEPKSVDLFVFSGLLNETVVSEETGRKIIEQALLKARDYAYIMIAGRTAPLFDSNQLLEQGLFPLLRTKWHASHFHFFPFYLCLAVGKEDCLEYLSVCKEF